jgi:Outer membrane protein beta-barrel domain
MHSNEFERQVQQKTGGLKITPSEGLWDIIEGQLPPEKKLRRPLVWLLLLLMIAGGTSLWLVQRQGPATVPANAARPANDFTKPMDTNKTAAIVHEQPGKTSSRHPMPVAVPNPANAALATAPLRPISDTGKGQAKQSRGNWPRAAKLRIGNAEPVAQTDTLTKRQALPQPFNLAGQLTVKANGAEPQLEAGTTGDGNIDGALAKLTNQRIELTKEGPTTELSQLLQPVNKVPVAPLGKWPKANKKGWHFGIALAGGVAMRAEKIFPFMGNTASINPAQFNAADSFYLQRYTAPKNGISFGAQWVAERSLGKRWDLQTGLGYAYMSTRQLVGPTVPIAPTSIVGVILGTGSFVNYVTRTGNASTYTNRFHLLQLPIGLQYKWGNQQQWRVQAGVAPSYLLGTNTLIYKSGATGFIREKALHNRLQLSAQTGFSFCPQPSSSFALGLRFSYNINSLVDKEYEVQRLLATQFFCYLPLGKK